ncbi:MAG TPA: SDR family oxidoreductase [Gammaproteobacteria bacterium]|nr:SDR family oxidoreductase [Gammaproteobacteria bacterium]
MLKEKVVFITGASSGIGEACAHYFAKAGARLLLCARRIDVLKQLASQLQNAYGVKVQAIELDVCQRTSVKNILETLPHDWQQVEVLINNAGLAAGLDTIQEGSVDDWEAMIDTNVKGLLYVTKEILPGMIERNSGHIINIGSISGHQVYPKGAVYCATKHAVNALTQGLRMDLLGTKVRVSTVDPGAVETNFSIVRFKGDKERAAAVYEGRDALTPNDVADAVLYCATRPSHVNISEVIIMPTDQVSVTMVSRKTDNS